MKMSGPFHLLPLLYLILFTGFAPAPKTSVTGSWMYTKGNDTWVLMAADQYCMVAHYDANGKTFFKTFGGFQYVEKGVLQLNYRFHSGDKSKTGTTGAFTWKVKNGYVESNLSGETGKMGSCRKSQW